eukprot:gene3736-14287_t
MPVFHITPKTPSPSLSTSTTQDNNSDGQRSEGQTRLHAPETETGRLDIKNSWPRCNNPNYYFCLYLDF